MLIDGVQPTIVDTRAAHNRERDGIIPGALDLESLDVWEHDVHSHAEVVVYCACPNEASAARAAKRLISRGFRHVRPLTGGIHAWVDAGYEVRFP